MSESAALEAVIDHVRANAERYLGLAGEPSAVEVHVEPAGSRLRARLHRLELRTPEGSVRLVAKETSLPDAPEASDPGDRPRLTVPSDTHERHRYEYLGLRAAEEHFAAIGDSRFLVVRAVDHLPDQRVILMEDVEHPTLRDLLAGPPRFTISGQRRINRALVNAGGWLREFHGLAIGDESPPLRGSAAEVDAAIRRQAAFVAEHGGGDEIARVGARAGAAIAAGAVRDPLPVAVWHQDFAPRNVFVAPDGRVAGFDMAARRRAPVYEDIAYFVMNLRSGRGRRLGGLMPWPPRGYAAGARQFLYGYFGDVPIARRALAVFGVLVRLDEWARLAVEGGGGRAKRALRAEVLGLCDALEAE